MIDYGKYRNIKTERHGKVLKLSLNRPESLNAVNGELHRELSEIFGDVNRDRETFAVLLTGEGRAFCAGGDIKGMQDPGRDWQQTTREAKKIINDILDLEQPIIAAVNGAAVGLGATIALFCDVIFASDRARLGDPHVKVGITAGDGGAVIWPLLCGVARAKEMLMTGDLISADEAYRLGLVNHVVPHDELMDKAMEFAQRMANGPAYAIRSTKMSVNKLIQNVTNLILDTSLAMEGHSFRMEDQGEAVKAFLEKREPRFTGR
jgi:enoyl-CoA hydratase